MSLPAIELSGLSKRYFISHEARHDNLRDTLHQTARSLMHRLRRGGNSSTEEFLALNNISFSVNPGEVVGIIGRNGAGKSTLLKILSRITEPSSGRITLRGRVASLLEVGTGFHPDLTGRENIFLNGAILGMSRAEIQGKFDEIVAFAEVERFLDTPVKRYSSGMYVRLAFAVAAHLEPEILIVDEVLAVGDAAFQEKCLGRMRAVARGGGRTVLFVSHQLTSVARICSRAIHMERGVIAADGNCADVLASYLRGVTNRQSVVDLTSAARDSAYRHKAKIVSASSESATEWSYPFGSPLRLSVDLLCANPFPRLEIGLMLINSYGVEVASTVSAWSGDPGPFPTGKSTVSIELPQLNLSSGSYTAHLGVRSADTSEDFIPHALSLRILEPVDAKLQGAERFSGCLLLESAFRLQPPR